MVVTDLSHPEQQGNGRVSHQGRVHLIALMHEITGSSHSVADAVTTNCVQYQWLSTVIALMGH
jgi:hypothetical protein